MLVFALALQSCALQRKTFAVIPGSPAYLLRSPDARLTPFPEILRHYNGFEPGRGSIDLRPLMELRVENAYYQPGSSRRGLDGFLGTEIARYQVRPAGLKLVSVQPMPQRPPADPPVQQLIAEPVAKARFYRLYYEIVFNKVKNSHGSVLLAADSTAELAQLSAKLDHPETVCADGSTHCTVFPEACSVSIEMQVVVNGQAKSLLWGAVLESIVGSHPQLVRLRRLYAGRLGNVQIDGRDTSALKLTLVPGDHVDWN